MALHTFTPLTEQLRNIQREIEGYAKKYGLDFFPTIFELVDHDQLNAIAAYGGFPTRYPHWRFGMEYEQLSKGYSYGLQKIYELVINNNPCYAYLMKSNELTDQKLVMAHVYGHCDFFKNNKWFSMTNRKMMDEMANHGNRVRRHMDRHGVEEVETFIDACLSLEDLIDIYSPFIKRDDGPANRYDFSPDHGDDESADGKFKAKQYMDRFINPPDVLKAQQDAKRQEQQAQEERFPAKPRRDILQFLIENAPLKPWQADVLSIIRDEAYYFAPQGQTKIMNEGWATYWHSTIMTRHGLEPADVINYADHTAGTLATQPGRLNPYKLGLELFRDIEDRWNRGKFGREYDECDDWRAQQEWNTEAGLGREKIFEVRQVHNDITFIDTFLTPEFCRRQNLFSFAYNERSDYYEVESREFQQIKQRLLFGLTNRGRPHIYVRDANHKNRGELYLEHHFEGVELDLSYAKDTLVNLFTLWKRPVHIETLLEDQLSIVSFDGTEHHLVKEKSPSTTA